MMRLAATLTAWLCACLAIGPAHAEPTAGCAHTLETVPTSVRTILTPYYSGDTPESALGDASAELQVLMSEANVCRLVSMDSANTSPTKQRDIMEWHSLNQWLTRLVNFTGLNARGHTNVNWRDEYELFSEVYEMKI